MKRRDFVLKGGLASIALATAPSVGGGRSFGSASEMINIGIIGTGDRGGGLIPVLQKIPHMNVAACRLLGTG